MTNILIVDDHPIVTEGLRKLFYETDKKYNCAVAGTVEECINALKAFIPDIILLDINLPDGSGIDLCKTLKQQYSSIKILAISSFSQRSLISRMMENGAMGYILKNSSEEEILQAVEEILSGKQHLGYEVNEILKQNEKSTGVPVLSRRETEVLQYIAEGYTNQEIADKMFISSLTVDSHRKNMLLKLNARNTASLIKIAIHLGYIDAN